MIHLLDNHEDRAATGAAVIAGFDDHQRAAIASRGQGDPGQVERVEAKVAADRRAVDS